MNEDGGSHTSCARCRRTTELAATNGGTSLLPDRRGLSNPPAPAAYLQAANRNVPVGHSCRSILRHACSGDGPSRGPAHRLQVSRLRPVSRGHGQARREMPLPWRPASCDCRVQHDRGRAVAAVEARCGPRATVGGSQTIGIGARVRRLLVSERGPGSDRRFHMWMTAPPPAIRTHSHPRFAPASRGHRIAGNRQLAAKGPDGLAIRWPEYPLPAGNECA
jgi:hypothetical protein